MNEKVIFLSGLVCGALMMYILDPSAGGRRRERVTHGVSSVGQRLGFPHRETALREAEEVVKAAFRRPVGGSLAPQDDGSLNPS